MSGATLTIPETLDANPPPVDENVETPHLNPRTRIMEEIAEKRARQMDAENAQAAIYNREATEAGLNFPPNEDEETPIPEQEEAREVAPPPAQRPAREVQTPAPVTPVAAPQPQPQVRIVTVDGNQFAITEQQADELMRLGMIANKALHSYQQPAPEHTPEPVREPERPRVLVDPDIVRETVKKIQYGGEDEAAEALTSLVANAISHVQIPDNGPRLDPNAIINQAVAQSRAQAQLIADQHVIQQEFADIFENQQRTLLAKWNVDALRQRDMTLGIRRPDLEVYREAGNMVRQAMGAPTPQPEQTPVADAPPPIRADRSDIIERKRNAPRPTQTVDIRAPAPQVARAPTGSEIVDRMRAARNQPSLR